MIGRPAITGDTDDLRAALATLKAMYQRDLEGITVIGRHSDPFALEFGWALIVIDALAEPPTSDVGAYVERLFERLDRGRQ